MRTLWPLSLRRGSRPLLGPGSSFSRMTDAPKLQLSLDKQSPGGPMGSGEASAAFVSGLWAWCGQHARQGDHGSPPTATPPAHHLPEKILFLLRLLPGPGAEWGRAPWLGGHCQRGLRPSSRLTP